MEIFAFGEIVSSFDFSILFFRSMSLFNQFTDSGYYLQGIPIREGIDFVWGSNSGIRTVPILFFLSAIQLFFGHNWTIVYFFISLFLPFFSFYWSAKFLNNNNKPLVLFSSVFFSLNPWIVHRLTTGFWQLNIAYAFTVWLVVIPLVGVANKIKYRHAVIWSFVASIVLIGQPHFLVIVGIWAIMYWTIYFFKQGYGFAFFVKFFFLLCCCFVLFNAYFLIPSIVYPERSFSSANQYYSISAVRLNGRYSKIQNIVGMNTWKDNSDSLITNLFSSGCFLYLIYLFVSNKNRSLSLFVSFALTLFLLKGVNPPFSELSEYLYRNVFLLSYFRDPSRFWSGVIIFMLVGILHRNANRFRRVGGAIFVLILIFIAISGGMSDLKKVFHTQNVPTEYIEVRNAIENIGMTRVAVLPYRTIDSYSWYRSPSPQSTKSVFDSILPINSQLVNSNGYSDTLSSQVSLYLLTEFLNSCDQRVLMPLGVTHVVLDKYAGHIKCNVDGDILFQKGGLSVAGIAPKGKVEIVFAVGDYNTIKRLQTDKKPVDVVLLNQLPMIEFDQWEKIGGNLFLDVKQPAMVLAAEDLAKQYYVDLLEQAWHYDKNFYNFESYKSKIIEKKGELLTSGRSVVSTQRGKMSVDVELTKGEYFVISKSFSVDVDGRVRVGFPNKDFVFDTNSDGTDSWQVLGTLSVSSPITNFELENVLGTEVVIDYLLFVPSDKWNEKLIFFDKYISEFNLKKVMIEYANHSYGTHWNRDSKLLVNGYALGWIADKNYGRLEYYPNKLYKACLAISLGTTVIVAIFILRRAISFLFGIYFPKRNL